VNKGVEHLPELRQTMATANDRSLDDLRVLAVLPAWTCFALLAGRGWFRTTDRHADVAESLGKTTASYTLSQLRYDLGKSRGKGLVERVAGTPSYRRPSQGYRIAVLDLKRFHRIHAPLTAGIIAPVPWEDRMPPKRRAWLDRGDAAVDRDLDRLFESVGRRLAG
jgi:hypothetical protein